MATLLEIKAGDETVLVDVTPGDAGVSPVGTMEQVIKKSEHSLDAALKVAANVAQSFQRVVDEYRFKEAELELGFQFTGKGNLYLVQSEAQAALKIKLVFECAGKIDAVIGSPEKP